MTPLRSGARCRLPGTGKSFEQFQSDDLACRQWASQQTGTTPERASGLSCRGYVKTLTVLLPTPPTDIALADLDSLDLDLSALAHGYHRPPSPGRMTASRVVVGGPPRP